MNQLIKETQPTAFDIAEGKSFVGIDFGDNGVPVDMAAYYLTGADMLLVDNFRRLQATGCQGFDAPLEAEERIVRDLEKITGVITTLGEAFGRQPEIIRTSDFMSGTDYQDLVQEASSRVLDDLMLNHMAFNTAPRKMKGKSESFIYTINQAACCGYLADKHAYAVKLGPGSEKPYDEVTSAIAPNLTFAYVQDAHPLRSDAVVQPYKTSGYQAEKKNRIILGEPLAISVSKIDTASETSLRSLARIASEASVARGGERLTDEEILSMGGRSLRLMTMEKLVDNLLAPYNQATASANRMYKAA